MNLARAWALARGRGYVLPDDVKALVVPTLGHRIMLSHEAKITGRTAEGVLGSILSGIAVPYGNEQELQGVQRS